ncbi:MAG: tRNA pseudouridine(55) synthase TruB [Candidatus Saccharimonadales bacterium]
MNGIILVDKPQGWSSFDIIRKFRNQLSTSNGQAPKMGHAGTLDPMATGLVIVLVGNYTKKQDKFMKLDKVYEAKITLGSNSDTDDAEGNTTKISDHQPRQDVIESALNSFIGNISQIPPQFSAIKVDGVRAYKKARSGGSTKLKARDVNIYSIELLDYDYPTISIRCEVGSGTYIRSLARDLGASINTGAYLSGLRRLSIGDLSVEDAISPEAVNEENIVDVDN